LSSKCFGGFIDGAQGTKVHFYERDIDIWSELLELVDHIVGFGCIAAADVDVRRSLLGEYCRCSSTKSGGTLDCMSIIFYYTSLGSVQLHTTGDENDLASEIRNIVEFRVLHAVNIEQEF
jgi:hypothetical protein